MPARPLSLTTAKHAPPHAPGGAAAVKLLRQLGLELLLGRESSTSTYHGMALACLVAGDRHHHLAT